MVDSGDVYKVYLRVSGIYLRCMSPSLLVYRSQGIQVVLSRVGVFRSAAGRVLPSASRRPPYIGGRHASCRPLMCPAGN